MPDPANGSSAPAGGEKPGAGGADNNNAGGGPGGANGSGPQSVPIKPLPAGGGDPAVAAGDIYKPEGIAPELIGKNNNETIDNLFKANKGFRDAQSKRGNVPEKADAYALGEIPAEIGKKLTKDLSKDPAVGALREVAHELGLTDKQFSGMVPKLLERFDKMGVLPDASAFDPETQIGELMKDHPDITDPVARRVAAAKRIPEIKAKLDNLHAAKVLDKDEHAELLGLLPQAKTFRLLEKIVGKFTATDGTITPHGDGAPSGEVSEADVTARRMDPRYDTRSPKHDPKFREETDHLWQKIENRKRECRAA